MQARLSVDPKAAMLMVAISLVWALQTVGLKVTSADASPVLQIGLRSGLAGALVLATLVGRLPRLEIAGRTALYGAFVGVIFGTNYFVVGEALVYTTASHVVVFLYTGPIFAAVGMHVWLRDERLAPLQWLGILFAAAGIAYAFLGAESQPGSSAATTTLYGDMLALLGGALWGVTTVLIRCTRLSVAPPTHILFYQLVFGFLVLTPGAVLTGNAALTISLSLLANMAFQTVIVSFASFLLWFHLLKYYKAGQLGIFSFMTPMFGVLLGHVLLGDVITAEFVIGAAGVLAGIILVSSYPWLAKFYKRVEHR